MYVCIEAIERYNRFWIVIFLLSNTIKHRFMSKISTEQSNPIQYVHAYIHTGQQVEVAGAGGYGYNNNTEDMTERQPHCVCV